MSSIDDEPHGSKADDTATQPETQPESRRISSVFSLTRFVLALIVIFVVQFIGRSSVPSLPAPGIGAVAFVAIVFGLLDSERRYLEIGTAGAIIQGIEALMFSPFTVLDSSARIIIALSASVTALIVTFVFHFIARYR